jgi:phytoene synthase
MKQDVFLQASLDASQARPAAPALQSLPFPAEDTPPTAALPSRDDGVSEEEALMRGGSKSFFAASRLLPASIRSAAVDLYAFCRVTDDAVDNSGASPRVMEELHERLDALYAVALPTVQGEGKPPPKASAQFAGDLRRLPHVADRAFARVVRAHRLPKRIPLALLEGFQWDAQGRRYETIEDVYDYSARVAGTVGAMMALVMGVREARPMARACELGVAMQLTNIARDVGEDARMGRLYLPRQWMREEGLDPDVWLSNPSFGPALGRVVARLLKAADGLYRRAEEGVGFLPRRCRPAILAARHIYADIGRVITKADYNSFDHRAVVSGRAKLQRLLLCMPAAILAPRMPRGHKPLSAIEFLVEAAGLSMQHRPPRSVAEKAGWMVDLIIRLEERERESRSSLG